MHTTHARSHGTACSKAVSYIVAVDGQIAVPVRPPTVLFGSNAIVLVVVVGIALDVVIKVVHGLVDVVVHLLTAGVEFVVAACGDGIHGHDGASYRVFLAMTMARAILGFPPIQLQASVVLVSTALQFVETQIVRCGKYLRDFLIGLCARFFSPPEPPRNPY